ENNITELSDKKIDGIWGVNSQEIANGMVACF
ncbi:MAG: hypothetical protein ACI83D_000705, partial [Planctomycetota bacterium]